jgi:hypothetical protein
VEEKAEDSGDLVKEIPKALTLLRKAIKQERRSAMTHGDKYKSIAGALLKECPVPVEAYAMVAIGEDGQLYWGASFQCACDRKIRMVQFLNIILRDIKSSIRSCKVHDHSPRKREKYIPDRNIDKRGSWKE